LQASEHATSLGEPGFVHVELDQLQGPSHDLTMPWLAYKIDKPITTLNRNLIILGPIPQQVYIFQRCGLVSQIKPKWNFNFLIKIVISMNF